MFVVRTRMDSSVLLASASVPFPLDHDNILTFFFFCEWICAYIATEIERRESDWASLRSSVMQSINIYI